jgi:hypothetical protein
LALLRSFGLHFYNQIEIAAPFGLAMTSVLFGGFDGRMWTMADYQRCASF